MMLHRRVHWESMSVPQVGLLDREIEQRAISEGLTMAQAALKFARIVGG